MTIGNMKPTSGTSVGPPEPGKSADASPKPYKVLVSLSFLIFSGVACTLLAFTVGRAARLILIQSPQNAVLVQQDHPHPQKKKVALPPPILLDGKEVPRTVYTAKNFDTAASATSSSLLIQRNDNGAASTSTKKKMGEGWQVCSDGEDGGKQCTRGQGHKTSEEEVEEEEHLPAGQHLLVDIKDVDGEFLNSEERLAEAMIDVVSESRLTLLSYHCHSLVPNGVSCVGVLLESHISFHTWPDEGVITLDLFTCGSAPLVPVVPIIERLFGVPRLPQEGEEDEEELDPPVMLWAHKLRGFRELEGRRRSALESDLGNYVLGVMDLDMKKEIVSVETEFQRIDIYDVIEPRFRSIASYHRSLSDDGSYESLHSELFAPERRVFLDGVMQSTRYGCEAYHEALVHPAAFAHDKPERVAIIGGGEGATLREVLKHNTIVTAVMVEIDEEMVNVSRDYLPDWNDCSDLVGSAPWCVEDQRSDVYYEDALAWFMDRFGGSSEDDDRSEDDELDNRDPFDIIIMDALDPQDNVPFADALYNNPRFTEALYESLTDQGIIVMQLGESPHGSDPRESICVNKNRARVIKLLERAGFQSVHFYEEAHSGFLASWAYLVAFKDYNTRKNWYRNEAEVELEIHSRLVRTHSGTSSLKYFDGATMRSYQIPSKAFETVYCREEPMPAECEYYRGFNPEKPHAPISSFEVRTSSFGEHAGRGLFAKVDIPEYTMLGAEQCMHFVHFPPTTYSMMYSLQSGLGAAEKLRSVLVYAHGYGVTLQGLGNEEVYVDSSIFTFVNHGCNGTYNIGSEYNCSVTEFNADPMNMPEELHGMAGRKQTFSPVIDRHLRFTYGGPQWSMRNIRAGEELLDNYLLFCGGEEEWEGCVQELRAECSGQQLGVVSAYEQEEG